MDIRELRYFSAVFAERNLTAAARRCFISQPSISEQSETRACNERRPLWGQSQHAEAAPEGRPLARGGTCGWLSIPRSLLAGGRRMWFDHRRISAMRGSNEASGIFRPCQRSRGRVAVRSKCAEAQPASARRYLIDC
jgi:Bacterial regulatory helix-turn-helix protein, lysR family